MSLTIPDQTRYELKRRLTGHQRTEVWEAFDHDLERLVVIKIATRGDQGARSAIEREWRLRQDRSPSAFVPLLDGRLGTSAPYLVSERMPLTLSSCEPTPMGAEAARRLLHNLLAFIVEIRAIGCSHTAIAREHVLLDWAHSARMCGFANIRAISDSSAASDRAALAMSLAVGRLLLHEVCGTTGARVPSRETPRDAMRQCNPTASKNDPELIGLIEALLHPDESTRITPDDALARLEAPQIILAPRTGAGTTD